MHLCTHGNIQTQKKEKGRREGRRKEGKKEGRKVMNLASDLSHMEAATGSESRTHLEQGRAQE